MEASIRKGIMAAMAEKPDDVYKAAAERNRATVGLDALLKEKEDRIAATEALLQKQQTGRLPLWVTQLQEFSRANPRAGLGAQLGLSGAGAEKTRAEYQAEDRAFNAEINKLRDSVLQAKIEGRYKDAAAGEAAIKDLTANRRQAESSGASLLNTKAQIAATKQTAKDALEGRLLTAKGQLLQQQALLEERIRHNKAQESQAENDRLARLEKFVAEEERKWADTLSRNPQYKMLALEKTKHQMGLLSKDPERREKAQVALGAVNEQIAQITNELRAQSVQPQAGAAPSAKAAPTSKAQYDALPKGATYTAPDGSQRVKG